MSSSNTLWKQRNPERIRELWRRNKRDWYARHPKPKKIRIPKPKSPEGNRIDTRKYADRREYFKIYCRLYRYKRMFLEKNALGMFTRQHIIEKMAAQNGLCVYCSCDISKIYTIDHIHPLSRGGSNFPDNIQLLCRPCNSKKCARTHDEHLARIRTGL